MTEPQPGASSATGTTSTAVATAAAATGGAARYTNVDPSGVTVLLPTAAAAHGTAGAGWSRRPWKRAFQFCTRPGRSGADAKTTDELHNSGNHHLVVHPITPTRAAASSTTTRPIR